jgi:hypothetical protein
MTFSEETIATIIRMKTIPKVPISNEIIGIAVNLPGGAVKKWWKKNHNYLPPTVKGRTRKGKNARAQAAMMQLKKCKNSPKSIPGAADKSKSSNKRGLEIDSDVVKELTYDQKRELSENINILTQDQLWHALQIIRENTHIDEVLLSLFLIRQSQGEEIVLDIDSIDKVTLWKLYTFVTKHTQENSRLDSSDSGSDCIHVRDLLDYDYDSEAEWEEDEPGEELKSEDDMDDDEGITDCEASIAG